jgi:hypothetical protein
MCRLPARATLTILPRMTERRYSEEEVAAIFDRATKAQAGGKRQLPPGEGMTLAGLQEIGREVGIPGDLVAEAARSIDLRGRDTTRRILGLPVGVGKVVDFGRPLSDKEWELLVVDLRQTFDATGRLRVDGSFRQWSNGNLKVMVEPTPTGHQVRFQTLRSRSTSLIAAGSAMLVAAILLVGFRGLDPESLVKHLSMGAAAVGLLAWGAIPLPAWARLRRRQMEELVARLKP